ncbi:hypothetical protein ACT3SP_08025 [Brachybacterium sp. AOP43-C2-M15]|uniref:hypothetical protein n=1 Tax=Brachybacterium sp. AOP43-C2-M15 TaxID=3457661 RepID=UPI004033CFA7
MPVFSTPSSVSIAPSCWTTQSGKGCGPRSRVWAVSGQVDQRWSSSSSATVRAYMDFAKKASRSKDVVMGFS